MTDSFFKAIRWFLFVSFIIGGIAAIDATEIHGFRTAIIAILCFGMAYIMSGPWRGLPKVPMISNVILLAVLAFLASYLPDMVYVYLGKDLDPGFYVLWTGLAFAVGVPVMTFIFGKYRE